MKILSSKLSISVLLLSLIAISCKKDSTEKKENSYANITYFAKASGTGVKSPTTKATNTVAVNWASASVYVEKISFVGTSSNLVDTTISVEKDLNIFSEDALTGIIQLPAGSYKGVKVKLFLRKSPKSELAFNLKGTFINTKGGQDSVIVASSFPFEANLGTTDLTINPADNYKVMFNFDLNKVLTGISTEMLQTAKSTIGKDNKKIYFIWKGGSADEPFYNQVTVNWQTVASVLVSK